jgi:hypothetical protein
VFLSTDAPTSPVRHLTDVLPVLLEDAGVTTPEVARAVGAGRS